MSMFLRALDIILEHENGGRADGGLNQHPDDPGGVTKWGIAQRYHPDVDVRRLTRAQAAEIYKREYWNACRCDSFPWPIALYLFDCAVNPGVAVAKSALQEALRVNMDGIIGPVTIAASRKADPRRIVIDMHVIRSSYWRTRKNFITFKNGWTARAAGTLWECARE